MASSTAPVGLGLTGPAQSCPGQSGAADPAFRADVLAGLSAKIRAIPARWLYDQQGSQLFDDITTLPEYYPTRLEAALLDEHAEAIAARVGPGRAVVEFGAGSATKTPLLLSAVQPGAYVPIDIAGDYLLSSARQIGAAFPECPVHPLVADFLRPFRLPEAVASAPKLGFFPGSTIGNMVARTATDLLRAMREALGTGALLLIGMDRIKDPAILIPAYDDAAGVTAAFNRNLLHRINRELAGTIPVDAFRHRALWNDARARIEMHLEATGAVRFLVDGAAFAMAAGETIHTENSHKYGPRDASLLLRAGGWTPIASWTDPKDWYALILAEAQPVRTAP